jgi:hypothetical protein
MSEWNFYLSITSDLDKCHAVQNTMKSFEHFSSGQNYCGVVLNLYKSVSRKVVLSSFNRFNVGKAQYQQMPWMANVGGVPVWSQTGISSGMTNTFAPSVIQQGHILTATYVRSGHEYSQ